MVKFEHLSTFVTWGRIDRPEYRFILCCISTITRFIYETIPSCPWRHRSSPLHVSIAGPHPLDCVSREGILKKAFCFAQIQYKNLLQDPEILTPMGMMLDFCLAPVRFRQNMIRTLPKKQKHGFTLSQNVWGYSGFCSTNRVTPT